MAKKILSCKQCWIPVTPVRKSVKTYGKGGEKDIQYKHKSLKDDVGQPFCGKVVLGDEDVVFMEQVMEFHPSDEY